MKFFKKSVVILLCGYTLFLLIEHVALLYKSDVSLQTPYFNEQGDPTSKPFTCLISYADGDPIDFKNQMGQVHAALNKGFDHFILWQRNHLALGFYEKNRQIWDHKAGAEVGLWKPYIMLKTMDMLPENSLITYMDGPSICIKPIDKFIQMMGKDDILLIENRQDDKGFSTPIREAINRENLERFGLDREEILKKIEIRSCFYIMRNTPRARHFVHQWLSISVRPEVVLRTDFDPKRQHHSAITPFGYPEQDTLFITKELYPQGVKVIPWSEWKGHIINVWRKSNNDSRPAAKEAFSFLPEFSGFHKISHFGYNSAWMVKLRQWIMDLF